MCTNTTENNNTCASSEEIEEWLYDKTLYITYFDKQPNFKNKNENETYIWTYGDMGPIQLFKG